MRAGLTERRANASQRRSPRARGRHVSMVAQPARSVLTICAEGEAPDDLPVPVLQPRELCLCVHREEVWRRQPSVQGVRADFPDQHQLYVTTCLFCSLTACTSGRRCLESCQPDSCDRLSMVKGVLWQLLTVYRPLCAGRCLLRLGRRVRCGSQGSGSGQHSYAAACKPRRAVARRGGSR
jgi:hypothetical protein